MELLQFLMQTLTAMRYGSFLWDRWDRGTSGIGGGGSEKKMASKGGGGGVSSPKNMKEKRGGIGQNKTRVEKVFN